MEASRKAVLARNKADEKMFLKLCKELDIDPDSVGGNVVYDYIFNDYKSGVKFKYTTA